MPFNDPNNEEPTAFESMMEYAVPAGCAATGVVLLSGLGQFAKNDAKKSQMFMRARVVAQGVTVAVMMAGLAYGLGGSKLRQNRD